MVEHLQSEVRSQLYICIRIFLCPRKAARQNGNYSHRLRQVKLMTKGAMGNAQENMYTFMPFPKPATVRTERVTGEMEDKPEPEQVCSVPAAETASAEGKNSAC